MGARLAINGFGRIGRAIVRAIVEHDVADLDVVAVNDLVEVPTLAHLLRFDSVHGRFATPVEIRDDRMRVGRHDIAVSAIKDPAELPWKSLAVDLALECTGRFRARAAAGKHLEAGARAVLISAPADDADLTIVYGINQGDFDRERHRIVSNASCTTNCVAIVAKVLDELTPIQKAQMTTVHAYTNDQMILDLPHRDVRRARAAAISMIPTTTGAARSVGRVLPRLKGKIDGTSIRVPVSDVSIVELTAVVERTVTVAEVNQAMRRAAEGAFTGILAYTEEELVSVDYVHDPHSATVDSKITQVIDGNLVEVMAWYDNEWGFSCRMVDVARVMGAR